MQSIQLHITFYLQRYFALMLSKKWGDYKNYNLMLDTGALGYEKCIDMICEAAR